MIPVLYVIFQWVREKVKRRPEPVLKKVHAA